MPLIHGGHILIADSDPAVREGVSLLLESAGYETREADTGHAALAGARALRPDVVILDVHLRGLSGYEVCRQLRDDFGERLAIVFLSDDRTDPSDRVAGLLIGADDYLAKPFHPDELLARVHRLVVSRLQRAQPDSFELTRREHEVLALLVRGLERREIAQQLFISPKTVAKHIEKILQKLRVHSQAQAVSAALRYRLVDIESTADEATLTG